MTYDVAAIQDVNITSTFWSYVQRCSREKTLPSIIHAQKSLDHWTCLTWREGHEPKPHAFWDSDIYKIVEAACYFMKKQPDLKMMAVVEQAVDMIQQAQYPDGYISSFFTVHGVDKRWTNTRDLHELYCLGHLLEATVAYEELTGSGRLKDIAIQVIAHVSSIFGPEDTGKKPGYPGHQEIEIGLLRFYELTAHEPAFDLARYFITERGRRNAQAEIYWDQEAKARGADPYDDLGTEHKAWYHGTRDYAYHQADCPLVEAKEVKGHAVRAMYYYTAATDLVRLSAETDREALNIRQALQRLWRDLIDKRIYITGGIGNVQNNEGFGVAYLLNDLEDLGCYAETCATFALINWCQRLLRLELRSEYADVMETCLYNGFLGAVSIEGDAFYYQNVLRTLAGNPKERSKWFGVACCPPNVAKLLGSLGSLIYMANKEKNVVAVHLYIGSSYTVPETDVTISMTTDMPWAGTCSIAVKGNTGLALRIPAWATQYTCSHQGTVQDGYLVISGVSNETVQLDLNFTSQKMYANPRMDKDDICIVRGPLVYCIEDVDNSELDVDTLAMVDTILEDGPKISVGSLTDIITVKARCRQLVKNPQSSLYTTQPWRYEAEERVVTAIPYFLRSNRGGNGAMRVWTRRTESSRPDTNGNSHVSNGSQP